MTFSHAHSQLLHKLTDNAVLGTGAVVQDSKGLFSVKGDLIVNRPFEAAVFARVEGSVRATNAGLTTLKGFPAFVGGNCLVGANRLTNLDHAPLHVGMGFMVRDNQLTSLVNCPKCDILNAGGNPIKNLKGIPDQLIELKIIDCNLESLDGLQQVERVHLDWQPDLGLLKLLVAKSVKLHPKKMEHTEAVNRIQFILDKYAGQGQKGALACAAELADAGFKENAQW